MTNRNLAKRFAGLGLGAWALILPLSVQAATISGGVITYSSGGTNDFGAFANTVLGWANGSLGVGLAITSVLVGAAFAVAKNTPMPVLTGIALAAFIHWSPAIIALLMGAVLV